MNSIASVSNEQVGDLRRDFDRMKSDLRDLRTNLSELTGDAVRTAKSSATEVKQQINQTVKAASEKGTESIEAIDQQITAHPYISLAVALAAGMVVGFALTRKG